MPEMPDLEALVRATRPVPDPDWAARLDGRAAEGFRKEPWWSVLRADYLPALAVASVLAVIVVVAIAWPGGGAGNSSSSSAGAGGSTSRPMSEGGGSSSGSAASQAAPKRATTAPAPA